MPEEYQPDIAQEEDTMPPAAEENPVQEEPKLPDPIMDLKISMDRMEAYFRVKVFSQEQEVTPEEILGFLEEKGVSHGIQEEKIRDFCEKKLYYSELLCARGERPVNGTDGFLTFHFDTERKSQPKELQDGSVDYFNICDIEMVEEGKLLCTLTPPQDGVNGCDIYGEEIAFRPGNTPEFPHGVNTVESEDGLSLLAAKSGYIDYKKSTLNIHDVYIVNGDVDYSSGNVDFVGNVVVYGDVREGFYIKSGQDVMIRGMVEGAKIEAQGDINIVAGMNGMRTGYLKSGGNVNARFLENTTVECENDITVEVCLNSRLKAGGSILVKGRKSSIVGGFYEAEERIYANYIGADTGISTEISIVNEKIAKLLSTHGEDNSMDLLKRQYAEKQEDVRLIEEAIEQVKSSDAGSPSNLKKLIIHKGRISSELKELERKVEQAEELDGQLSEFKVIALYKLFPGVKMRIGPYTMTVRQEYDNTRFYAGEDGIVTAPVLPSDKLT